jgi:uncharacterized protein
MLDQVIKAHRDGVTITFRVIPNASRNGVAFDEERGRLVVRLSAVPVEGKANAELVRYLGKLVGVPRSLLTIIKGKSSREKVVLINGSNVVEVRTRLEDALGGEW